MNIITFLFFLFFKKLNFVELSSVQLIVSSKLSFFFILKYWLLVFVGFLKIQTLQHDWTDGWNTQNGCILYASQTCHQAHIPFIQVNLFDLVIYVTRLVLHSQQMLESKRT